MITVFTRSEADTRALGKSLGELLKPGDFVALYGDLGTGKTRFAQGIARGVGVDPEVYITSPTYTILNEYKGTCPLYHFDLYRLGGDADITELGFEEYFHGDGICLVEWAERLTFGLPEHCLQVFLHHESDDVRRIEFRWRGDRYGEMVRKIINSET